MRGCFFLSCDYKLFFKEAIVLEKDYSPYVESFSDYILQSDNIEKLCALSAYDLFNLWNQASFLPVTDSNLINYMITFITDIQNIDRTILITAKKAT